MLKETRLFLKKIFDLVAFLLKPRGCLVVNIKICEQRQYAIGSCTKNEQGEAAVLVLSGLCCFHS